MTVFVIPSQAPPLKPPYSKPDRVLEESPPSLNTTNALAETWPKRVAFPYVREPPG